MMRKFEGSKFGVLLGLNVSIPTQSFSLNLLLRIAAGILLLGKSRYSNNKKDFQASFGGLCAFEGGATAIGVSADSATD